jgi:Bacterial protein of unknown function (DUF916)
MPRTRLIRFVLPAILAGALIWAPSAAAAPAPPMTVTVVSNGGATGNYFQIGAHPGQTAAAGALQIRNQTDHSITVHLDPVDGQTASTLGSAYGLRGTKATGPATWLSIGERTVQLGAHGATTVPVSVQPPSSADPGDYLAGIGVQSTEPAEQQDKGNLAISSVQRYAVGVEMMLPGPRHPLIRMTGVKLTREPAGVTFSILARNGGNVILKNVVGSATVSDGSKKVFTRKLGPGTFVTGTSIAYPLLDTTLTPQEGQKFRVQAVLHYPGGTARLDKVVTFGETAAKRQQEYGGPKVSGGGGGGGSKLWLILLAAALVVAVLAALRYRERFRIGRRSVRPALEQAIAHARATGEPLSVILVGADGSSQLASSVRSCLRPRDGIFRANGSGLLVIAPDTTPQAGEVLADEIKRHLSRAGNGGPAVIPITSAAQSTPEELLEAASAAAAPAYPAAAPGNGAAHGSNGGTATSEVSQGGTEAPTVPSHDGTQYHG